MPEGPRGAGQGRDRGLGGLSPQLCHLSDAEKPQWAQVWPLLALAHNLPTWSPAFEGPMSSPARGPVSASHTCCDRTALGTQG